MAERCVDLDRLVVVADGQLQRVKYGRAGRCVVFDPERSKATTFLPSTDWLMCISGADAQTERASH